MKLSIITTITNPDKYQYAWREALLNFCSLADEVVVVNGGRPMKEILADIFEWSDRDAADLYLLLTTKIKEIMMPWPEEWHWRELPLHLNAGLAAATGDWVLKMDIDYLIRECEFADLRKRLEAWQNNPLVVSFTKTIILNRFRCYDKAAVPFCINKKLAGDSIKFGINIAEKTDWCYPVMVKGENPDGVPMGVLIPDNMMRGSGVRIYDYDYFFRTKEVARSEFWRFARAYATAFDKSWGETEEDAWRIWSNQYKGRLQKFLMPLALEGHPEAIRERIQNMRPDEFGFDNWGAAKF